MADESTENRRLHPRVPLRFQLHGREISSHAGPWTSNISAGGMYFTLAEGGGLSAGQDLAVDVSVPAGGGYASGRGSVSCVGKVVRVEPLRRGVGVAMRFTAPAAMRFDFTPEA